MKEWLNTAGDLAQSPEVVGAALIALAVLLAARKVNKALRDQTSEMRKRNSLLQSSLDLRRTEQAAYSGPIRPTGPELATDGLSTHGWHGQHPESGTPHQEYPQTADTTVLHAGTEGAADDDRPEVHRQLAASLPYQDVLNQVNQGIQARIPDGVDPLDSYSVGITYRQRAITEMWADARWVPYMERVRRDLLGSNDPTSVLPAVPPQDPHR